VDVQLHGHGHLLTLIADPDLLKTWDREARGIPIGRAAEVNLRNNHTQYIFTW
jgi:cytochrome oxidase assembly protein ShyY1